MYSKTCVKRSLKKDNTKILITLGSLMKFKSIAECSTLQYFWPTIMIGLKTNVGLFDSGRFTQVLLYAPELHVLVHIRDRTINIRWEIYV